MPTRLPKPGGRSVARLSIPQEAERLRVVNITGWVGTLEADAQGTQVAQWRIFPGSSDERLLVPDEHLGVLADQQHAHRFAGVDLPALSRPGPLRQAAA